MTVSQRAQHHNTETEAGKEDPADINLISYICVQPIASFSHLTAAPHKKLNSFPLSELIHLIANLLAKIWRSSYWHLLSSLVNLFIYCDSQ